MNETKWVNYREFLESKGKLIIPVSFRYLVGNETNSKIKDSKGGTWRLTFKEEDGMERYYESPWIESQFRKANITPGIKYLCALKIEDKKWLWTFTEANQVPDARVSSAMLPTKGGEDMFRDELTMYAYQCLECKEELLLFPMVSNLDKSERPVAIANCPVCRKSCFRKSKLKVVITNVELNVSTAK